MQKCIFCGIANEEIFSHIIYKDDIVTAFLDINPVSLGHTLVIPNKHFSRLDIITEEEVMKGLMQTLIKVSNLLVTTKLCSDFTIISDNGLNAQQDIMHTHFHIIPRHTNEKLELKLPTDKDAAKEEKLRLAYDLLSRYSIN